jgi:catechol 2,3-dioxygenase-like lactoylglutathione lyase family enzyme
MTAVRISHLGVNHKVRDFKRSRAFYEAFGFQVLFEFGPHVEQGSKFRGLFYQVGDALLEISEGHMAVKPEVFGQPVTSSKVSLMVYVESLAPVLDTCKEHSFEISVEPRWFPWGQIGVVLKDPDGLVIAFLSEDSPEERQKVQARTSRPLVRDEPDFSDEHVRAVRARSRS